MMDDKDKKRKVSEPDPCDIPRADDPDFCIPDEMYPREEEE